MDLLAILASWNPIDWIMKPVTELRQTIDLLMLGVKVVILLFIVQFVRGRFGGGPLVTILILIIGYIFLFQLSWIFEPMMLIYLFIIFGFTGLLFDLAIAKPWKSMGAPGGEEGGHMTSKEYNERLHRERSTRRRILG
jgi:hypothetical protein